MVSKIGQSTRTCRIYVSHHPTAISRNKSSRKSRAPRAPSTGCLPCIHKPRSKTTVRIGRLRRANNPNNPSTMVPGVERPPTKAITLRGLMSNNAYILATSAVTKE
uniref:Uncharacterized protein n=1 Tax=Romanomermis culicivorax TaxID=13658 RepID=A0A915KD17_ROMCU